MSLARSLTKRQTALITLTVQNASISLITRASRLGYADELYLPSVAVFAAEILKAIFSLGSLALQHRKAAQAKEGSPTWRTSLLSPLHEALVTRRTELLLVLCPSVLYSGQNNLLYVALSNLPVSIYQVTYQLKILTTCLFSILFFGRKYSASKWAALILLAAGVAIVQMGSDASSSSSKNQTQAGNPTLGFLAILAACTSSGIAGCYFEAILKSGSSIVKNPSNRPPPTLAMRNLQLAVVSLPFSLVGMLFPDYDRHRILSRGVLDRFDWLAWTVVVNQAVGGLLIAAVVKHADSVAKGFATSIAVILSTVVSSILSGSLPSSQFGVGAALVVAATTMFAAVQ